MTFQENIDLMGYEIKEKENGKIKIEREEKEAVLHIIFTKETKTMCGILQPKSLIVNKTQMKKLNEYFETLQEDLITFKDTYGYKIIC